MNILKQIILVGVTLTLLGCQQDKKGNAPPPKPVKVMTVPAAGSKVTRIFSGKIEAATKAILSFEVKGTVNKFPIKTGDVLKKGQFIASIDPHLYQEEVEKAKAEAELAKAQFDRGDALVKKNFISKSDYDLLKSKLNIANAKLSSAEKNLKDTQIYTPFDGIVIKKYIENFEYVQIRQPVISFENLDTLDVVIFLPESIVLQFKKGQEISPEVIFDEANKSYPITVKEFSAKAEKNTQTYRTLFTLKAPKEINILPGMSVKVKLKLPDYKNQGKGFIAIPSSAVFAGPDGKPNVWIVEPERKQVHSKTISTGDLIDNNIKVFSGLEPGEMIVTAGVHFLNPGQTIKPLEQE